MEGRSGDPWAAFSFAESPPPFARETMKESSSPGASTEAVALSPEARGTPRLAATVV